ncbi:retrotransposon protein [Artemisia annua]|uniref:Retrotransposon protein n=1 Tax=Artemisia annua TaxID=35608 RepID=A0A2U1LPR0_ARTAN|nr:retrotransposon protein [Artemisia annua]
MRGRLVYANPYEGERYYLRLLLSHVRGPTGFEYIYKVNGVLFTTFQKATLERGLIENDDSLSHCLYEASLFQFLNALRRLFATILIYCEPGDVRKLWNDHYESLSEDYSRHYESTERVQNMVLTDISVFLRSMGKSLSDFDLPNIIANASLESVGFREFLNALRRLFATILIYCEPGDVRKLWNDHYESLSEDYSRHYESTERVQNMVLTDISVFLRSMGKSLSDFDLPNIIANASLESAGFREVHEEYSIVLEDEHRAARDSLNHDQKVAYDNIMRHVTMIVMAWKLCGRETIRKINYAGLFQVSVWYSGLQVSGLQVLCLFVLFVLQLSDKAHDLLRLNLTSYIIWMIWEESETITRITQ